MYNIEEINKLLSDHRSDDKLELICSECGKVCTKRYRYVREQRALAEDSIVKIFCSAKCYYDNNNKHKYYKTVPCDFCGKEFDKLISQIEATNANYCSHSCAAKVNNSKRIRTEESRKKTSDSLRKIPRKEKVTQAVCNVCESVYFTNKSNSKYCSEDCRKLAKRGLNKESKLRRITEKLSKKPNPNLYSYIRFKTCKECSQVFYITSRKQINTKFCSKDCRSKNQSRSQSERISKAENRTNLGRHKKSYPETCMIDWLDKNQVVYEFESSIKNHELNKTYFPDFLFRDLSLIIELDGTQHRKTVEKDKIRDEYIERVYGIKVVRYWCKDFLKGIHYDEICKLLGIVEDKALPKFKV